MNDQQIEFANYMWDYYLSHETDFRFSSPKLDVNLFDDDASFLTLESRLHKVLDPPLTTFFLVVPSVPSHLRDSTMFIMTFLHPHFPLAEPMKFEVAGPFGIDTSVDEDEIGCQSGDVFIEVHDFDEILIWRSCMDAFDLIDHVSLDLLNIFCAFPTRSLPFPSPKCYDVSPIDSLVVLEGNEVDCFKSPSTFRGYNPSQWWI